MNTMRMKLTTTRALLLLAAACAAAIFLLDLCYLRPYVHAQKASALREQAGRTEYAAKAALHGEQEELARLSAACAKNPEIGPLLAARTPEPQFHSHAQKVFAPPQSTWCGSAAPTAALSRPGRKASAT